MAHDKGKKARKVPTKRKKRVKKVNPADRVRVGAGIGRLKILGLLPSPKGKPSVKAGCHCGWQGRMTTRKLFAQRACDRCHILPCPPWEEVQENPRALHLLQLLLARREYAKTCSRSIDENARYAYREAQELVVLAVARGALEEEIAEWEPRKHELHEPAWASPLAAVMS